MSETTALTKWRASGSSEQANKLPMWRKVLVFAGAIAAAGSLPVWLMDKPIMPVVIVGFALAVFSTAGMALSQKLSMQLLARSIWWQVALYASVFIGIAICHEVDAKELFVFWPVWAMLGGSIVSIAAAGKMGLTQDNAHFAPTGFRIALVLSLILALADTQALLFYTALFTEVAVRDESSKHLFDALPFLASAGLMMTALYGLYRLKIWGVGLNLVANFLIAGLALGGVLELPEELAGLLAATAVAQLLIPAPMLFTMFKNARAKAK